MEPSVCVVHLVWIPYGIELFKQFVDSYKTFNAGYVHQLVLLFNGISDEHQAVAYHEFIEQTGVSYQTFYYTKGQDLEAYKFVAGKLSCDYIFFLNSYSRILADNWLAKLVHASKEKNISFIGATGSFQSYYSSIFEQHTWAYTKSKSFTDNIVKYKLLVKALIIWRFYFKPFPNPHIRTNGFFINRKLFLSIKYKVPSTKFDAYRIESGRNSITQQLLRSGHKIILMDKFGSTYETQQWISSKIFWNANQENLLIADNQTDLYTNSSVENKSRLQKLAWNIKS